MEGSSHYSNALSMPMGYPFSITAHPQGQDMVERYGYGFTPDQKAIVHKRSKHCEFPEGCPEPVTGKVNHLTGVFIARMEGLERSAITNIDQNALLLCWDHERDLDRQEHYQQECIIYERQPIRRITTRPKRFNRSRFSQKRRTGHHR